MTERLLGSRFSIPSALLVAWFGAFAGVSPAHAQVPPDNPNHMCGSGEFTVNLPGNTLGLDDKSSPDWSIDAPDVARPDQITLPNGCRIYAFLISGWGDNDGYDQLIFYKFAEFVAQRNGYVHVGWWNNLGKEYMERPLHQETIQVTPQFLGFPIGPPANIHATPGTNFAAFLSGDLADVDLPKANPDEDFQFVNDLRIVLRAIRTNNPNALIILAGHSMGGNAIVHAVAGTDIRVDLLAPIDPVGNRDRPAMLPTSRKFSWTRWRATHDFKGWKVRDCIRNNEPEGTGLCRNYGTFFSPSFRCTTRGDWEVVKPLPLQGSLQPILCPGPLEDSGPSISIGHNIARLYHRWQQEAAFPMFDWDTTQLFGRPATRSTDNILSPNFQAVVPTCFGGEYDPRDDDYECYDGEGHGELVGVRVKSDRNTDEAEVPDGNGRVRPGLKLTDWPDRFNGMFTPGQRRERLIQLAVDGPAWPYQPKKPDLCLVCDDLIWITKNMLGEVTGGDELPTDTAPPASTAIATPEANAQGWYNEDVVVSVGASDNRSVQEIQVTLSGAQTDTTITPGNSASATISAEGLTTVSYFARDGSGNEESPHTLDIRIDRTAPDVSALTDVLPNANGWIGRPVVVSFIASDEAGGSGIATSSPEVSVSTEGANQEIAGSAEDHAGNAGAALATLNIDLTPPAIGAGIFAPLPNAAGWNTSPVTVTWSCTDALSGVLSSSDTANVGTEGAAQSAIGVCRDRADHVTTDTVAGINIDLTPPVIALDSRAPAANAAGWNNSAVAITWTCTDTVSGALDPTVSASIIGEGAAQSLTGQCADVAGHTATHTQGGINVDLTNPGVALASPASGGIYLMNAAVPAEFACTDALSGVASCAGSLASGALLDTASVGAKAFTVTANDAAANMTTVTHAYSVQYNFTGFAAPVRSGINQVNAGRTVPVKFSLVDANGAFISTLASFVSMSSNAAACESGEVFDVEGEAEAVSQTAIRYDVDANQFIYNWKTEKSWAGSCRSLTLTLADGTQHIARFRFQ